MELEVIRGTSRARGIGEIRTTLFAPRTILQQVRNWRSDSLFAFPGGKRLFAPFTGPIEQAYKLKFYGSTMWPGVILAKRAADINPAPIGGFPPNMKVGYTEAQAAQLETDLRAMLEQHIRNRETLLPDQPIPEAAWDVVDFPWTRDVNDNPFGALLDLIGTFLNRLNPALVLGRAGMLALTVRNYRGLATKMAANDPARVRAKWENWGGNWAMLRDAINEGKTKQPVSGADNTLKPNAPSNAPSGQFGTWLAAAKPILDAILSILGIDMNTTPETPLTPQQSSTGKDVADAVDNADNAASGGGGSGSNTLVWVVLGGLALVALASPRSKKRHGQA